MSRHNRADLKWIKNKLMLADEEIVSYVKDKTYPEMFRVKYSDGVLSQDFYNLARVRQHCSDIAFEKVNSVS